MAQSQRDSVCDWNKMSKNEIHAYHQRVNKLNREARYANFPLEKVQDEARHAVQNKKSVEVEDKGGRSFVTVDEDKKSGEDEKDGEGLDKEQAENEKKKIRGLVRFKAYLRRVWSKLHKA